MTTDEHPYLNKFRIWPDNTIQYVEGGEPPFSHMSDDFVTIMAAMDLHAFDIFDALNSGELRKDFEQVCFKFYMARRAQGDFENHPGRGDDTPEAMFWMTDDGRYGVHQIEAAWRREQFERRQTKLDLD